MGMDEKIAGDDKPQIYRDLEITKREKHVHQYQPIRTMRLFVFAYPTKVQILILSLVVLNPDELDIRSAKWLLPPLGISNQV